MKNIYFLFIFFLCVCCNDYQKNNSLKILEFPTWSDSLIFINCEEIISQTPISFNFKIYGDSIVDFNQFDNRINLKFKFNWHYKNYFDIGVNSIDFIKKDGSIRNIKLSGIEAFAEKDSKSTRFGEPVRNDITMIDINLDSYLDMRAINACGKSCEYEYWIYDKETNNYLLSSTFSNVNPYCIDCNQNILYSYAGGDAFSFKKIAYHINGDELRFLQSSYFDSWNKDFSLQQYNDSAGTLIFSDTIYKN